MQKSRVSQILAFTLLALSFSVSSQAQAEGLDSLGLEAHLSCLQNFCVGQQSSGSVGARCLVDTDRRILMNLEANLVLTVATKTATYSIQVPTAFTKPNYEYRLRLIFPDASTYDVVQRVRSLLSIAGEPYLYVSKKDDASPMATEVIQLDALLNKAMSVEGANLSEYVVPLTERALNYASYDFLATLAMAGSRLQSRDFEAVKQKHLLRLNACDVAAVASDRGRVADVLFKAKNAIRSINFNTQY